jgi:dTDP-4-amino-4,6-dideoxygalactose transaminase
MNGIFSRRYFYPLLNTLVNVKYLFCPQTEAISNEILWLSFYNGMETEKVEKIFQIIRRNL